MPRSRIALTLVVIYLILALFYVLWPIGAPAPVSPGDSLAFERELEARIPRFLEGPRVPGASVALIERGQVIWAGGFGLADVQRRTPVTPQTVFQAASISKTLTAWGVMRLVERGELDLDAPADKYLSRWHIPASDFDSNGVTIRRLLSHSSGLADIEYLGYPPEKPLPSLEQSLSFGPPDPTSIMKNSPGSMSTGGARIVVQPGQAYMYSDANYVLLQLVIEEVTGMPFAEYMQREVLTPLGMKSSSFAPAPEIIARTAVPYDVYARPLPVFRFAELAPAGLYSTASDLAGFVASGLSGPNGEAAGRGVISPTSVELMTGPAIVIPGFEGWIYADAYGFGYFIETLPGGAKLVSHMGGNPGWMCEFAAIPSTGDGMAVMTNSSAGQELFADVLTAWTTWRGQGEAHVANSIHTAQRLFRLVSYSMLAAALALLLRLLVWTGGSQRWPGPIRVLFTRIFGAALCVAVLAVYWAVLRPLIDINMPSQSLGMMWGVQLLCITALLNVLLIEAR